MDATSATSTPRRRSRWIATSDDVPGLVTEADTLEVLFDKLKVMVPELLELNREQAQA